MAPTPPNTALRMKIHYTGFFGTHVMLFHGKTGTTLATLAASVHNIVNLMKDACWDQTTFNTAEYSEPGSSIFLPYAPWVPVTTGSEYAPQSTDSPSAFVQFGGRSMSTGKRAKWYLFNTRIRDNSKMRVRLGANGAVDGVIAALDIESGVIAAIDGTTLGIYAYANVGQNDYLTHKARRS